MTDTRPWWPEGYGEDPAFQVRRVIYGTVTGGDYARGSSVLTLPHTALRYPTTVPEAAAAVGRAILHVRVASHTIRKEALLDDAGVLQRYIDWPVGSIEITWGWPVSIEDTWQEVALVRSAFGRPSTVNDGQTVLHGLRDAFVRRDTSGNPVLDEDGFPQLINPPIVVDGDTKTGGLPTGRWYHYGLFFKVSEVEWIQGMVDSCLLPRDFHHNDHLWNNVPPYYRWTDSQTLTGDGYLRQFLNVFGFELDTAREFIESWQHVYDVDWSPIRLLRKLGDNFGYTYEQGVGDVRFRSLFANLGHYYEIRGTQRCLEGVVSDMSKFECDVTAGANQMILPDDSDFHTGSGNWGVVLDQIDAPGSGYLGKDRVTYGPASASFGAAAIPPPNSGRGVLAIWTSAADATTDIGFACGASYVPIDMNHTQFKEVAPDHGGIPVDLLMSYGFTVWIRSAFIPTALSLSLLWFDGNNKLLSATSGPLTSVTAADTWQSFSIGGVFGPPAGAVYVCPYILFDTRSTSGAFPVTSPTLFLSGAMVYANQTIGEAVGPPPNRYLTISDPGEPLGAALNFKGNLSGASTPLPTGPANLDTYILQSPVPTAAPQYRGVTPPRNAANNDAIYWSTGSTPAAWINIGPIPNTWLPFLLGSPTPGGT